MIKILYIRDKFGKNKATVAYDLSNRQSGTVNFSIACCNSSDQFSKNDGISICNIRLQESPITIKIKKESSNADIVKSILTKISRSEIGSASARKLARKMLKKYTQPQKDNFIYYNCCYKPCTACD